MDGGWIPLPTHPQRYCDPASLVFLLVCVPGGGSASTSLDEKAKRKIEEEILI